MRGLPNEVDIARADCRKSLDGKGSKLIRHGGNNSVIGVSMEIKPIKNNRDYQEALKEIDRLVDARRNTAEGDRLDVLVTLVEAWEEKRWPIDAPNPVEAILLAM